MELELEPEPEPEPELELELGLVLPASLASLDFSFDDIVLLPSFFFDLSPRSSSERLPERCERAFLEVHANRLGLFCPGYVLENRMLVRACVKEWRSVVL